MTLAARAAPLAVAFLAQASSVTAEGTLHGELALATGYDYRGLRWSEDKPVASAYLEYNWVQGPYLGVWASAVDVPYYPEQDYLLSFYGGYTHRFNARWAVDATYFHHRFGHGVLDYEEVLVTVHHGFRWSVTGGYTDDYLGRGYPAQMVELTFRHPLPLELSLDATAGRQFLDIAGRGHYNYVEMGLSRGIGPVTLRYSLSGSDCGEGFYLCHDRGAVNHALSIAWPFPH